MISYYAFNKIEALIRILKFISSVLRSVQEKQHHQQEKQHHQQRQGTKEPTKRQNPVAVRQINALA